MTRLQDRPPTISAEVSPARAEALLEDFLKGRVDIGATRKLFEHFRAFEERSEESNEAAFGFDVILRKWPLMDRADWAPLRGWNFAVAEERWLMGRVVEALQKCVSSNGAAEGSVLPTADSLLTSSMTLAEKLEASGFTPGAVVIATQLSPDTMVQLQKRLDVPKWEMHEELRTNWILGIHHRLVIVYAAGIESHRGFGVDIPAFGRLVQFSPVAELSIEDVPFAEALKAQVPDPHNSVRLKLYQSYAVDVLNCRAAVAITTRTDATA